MLIQINESIYFFDPKGKDGSNANKRWHHLLKDNTHKVQLECIRGLSNSFYISVRDPNTGDTLFKFSAFLEKYKQSDGESTGNATQLGRTTTTFSAERLAWRMDKIPSPHSGQIMALEIDPLDYNDYDPYEIDDHELGHEKTDQIYVIDQRFTLIRLGIGRETSIVSKTDLSVHHELRHVLQTSVQNVNFVRMGISHRYLSIGGRTFNVDTGFDWDFDFNGTLERSENAGT